MKRIVERQERLSGERFNLGWARIYADVLKEETGRRGQASNAPEHGLITDETDERKTHYLCKPNSDNRTGQRSGSRGGRFMANEVN
jgi:hypothetical protein